MRDEARGNRASWPPACWPPRWWPAGNQGGGYLAIPRASEHQQDAFQLAEFLTSAPAETTLLRTDGLFPANAVAIDSIFATISAYFSGAPIGQIFSRAAYRMPTPILGPTGDLVQADVDAALTRVAGGAATPAAAWQAVLKQSLRSPPGRLEAPPSLVARSSVQAAPRPSRSRRRGRPGELRRPARNGARNDPRNDVV